MTRGAEPPTRACPWCRGLLYAPGGDAVVARESLHLGVLRQIPASSGYAGHLTLLLLQEEDSFTDRMVCPGCGVKVGGGLAGCSGLPGGDMRRARGATRWRGL